MCRDLDNGNFRCESNETVEERMEKVKDQGQGGSTAQFKAKPMDFRIFESFCSMPRHTYTLCIYLHKEQT